MLMLVSSILYACSQILATREPTEPRFYDPRIRSELVTSGLSSPTSMAFVDSKNILVLEKNSGEVHLVPDGILQDKPILTLRIDNTTPTCCRGLLGIETNNEYEKDDKITNVFIYLAEPTSQTVERERESTPNER